LKVWVVEQVERIRQLSKQTASYNRSLTFESSDSRCKLICQYSVLLFILRFDWLMKKYQELDGLFKAEFKKNYPIYFKFGQLSKIN